MTLMFSLMPLLTVALPGMCMLAMNRLPMPLHRVLLSLSFFVPTMGIWQLILSASAMAGQSLTP